MNKNGQNLSDKEFTKYCEELSEAIVRIGDEYFNNSKWSFHTTPDSPETFSELKKQSAGYNIPVNSKSCSTTIYGTPEMSGRTVNIMLRFWHDIVHLENNLGFSEKDEKRVCEIQAKRLVDLEVSPQAVAIFREDIAGQVEYYYKWGKFVENQRAFVQEAYNKGRAVALLVEF